MRPSTLYHSPVVTFPQEVPQETSAEKVCENVSAGEILSDDDKRAAMKRRYTLLQERQKIPIEEERRLKRQQFRNILPVWRRSLIKTPDGKVFPFVSSS